MGTSGRRVGAGAVLPVLALAVVLAAGTGCTSERGRSGSAAGSTSGPTIELDPLPEFRGRAPVEVRAGTVYYSDRGCRPDADEDVYCSVTGTPAYLVHGPSYDAHLVAAEMVLVRGGTSWTARITLDRDAARALERTRREARSTGAFVLLVDRDDEVVVQAPVYGVHGARIEFPGLTRREAWDLVELVRDAVAPPS